VFDHAYLVVPAQAYVADFLATFTDYPPSQRAASFSIDQIEASVMEQLNSIGSQ
jgi:arylsulfatase